MIILDVSACKEQSIANLLQSKAKLPNLGHSVSNLKQTTSEQLKLASSSYY